MDNNATFVTGLLRDYERAMKSTNNAFMTEVAERLSGNGYSEQSFKLKDRVMNNVFIANNISEVPERLKFIMESFSLDA